MKLRSLLAALLLAGAARADLIEVVAGRDTTLYSDLTASELSNGGGEYLFAGSTGENANFNLRRGLVWFDVDAALPDGAVVTSVELRLFVSRSPSLGPANIELSLHPALQDWGENLLSDPANAEGSGTAALAGDATWQHAFFDGTLWSSPGGDFAPAASATGTIGGFGSYFISGTQLTADVQGWADDPAANYGWFLIGDETTPNAARRFFSSNGADSDSAPTLVIQYEIVPEPAAAGLLAIGLAALFSKGWKRRREKFQ